MPKAASPPAMFMSAKAIASRPATLKNVPERAGGVASAKHASRERFRRRKLETPRPREDVEEVEAEREHCRADEEREHERSGGTNGEARSRRADGTAENEEADEPGNVKRELRANPLPRLRVRS